MSKKTGAQIRHARMLAKHGARMANRDIISIYGKACGRARDSWKILGQVRTVNDMYEAQAQCDFDDRLRGEAYDMIALLLDDYETIRIKSRLPKTA